MPNLTHNFYALIKNNKTKHYFDNGIKSVINNNHLYTDGPEDQYILAKNN